MKKPKDKKLRFKIVLIICVFLLIIITLYFKFASIKQTYALNEFEYKKNSLVVVSDAKNINIDDIIEKNIEGVNKEEIYERQEELEYITKYKNNNELYIGTTAVTQEGRNGIQTITMKKKYDKEGNFIGEEQVGARVTKSSLDKIIEIGTKVYVAPKVEKKYESNELSFNMALNKPSGLTIEQFKKVLTDNKDVNKIFENNSDYFYYIEDEYNINGIFVASIGIHESAWGTSKIAKNKYNLFGYGAYDSNPYNGAYSFSSYSESIDLLARVLVKYYLNQKGTLIYDGQVASGKYYSGNTVSAVNKKYATDKNWANCVYKYMEYLYNKI
ncbi:MAG TPA: hypothetical protein DEP51_02255 [Clostridiales bacterium]|nr:hypothetical protein [Clostridiales bacterium]